MKNTELPKAGIFLASLIAPMALILCAASFTGCLTGNSANGASGTVLGDEVHSEEYTVSGNRIITPVSSDTVRYCSGDSMRTEIYPDGPDSLEYSISDRVLSISNPPNTLQSGAVMQWAFLYTRSGYGSGLEGSWTFSGLDYRIISGAMTAAEKTENDHQRDYKGPLFELIRTTLVFGDGLWRTFQDRSDARIMIVTWNGALFADPAEADSAKYDIALREVDAKTVELQGRKSGETVRLERTSEGTVYTSDRAGHAPFTYYTDPKTCPNDGPEWYDAFKSANLKRPPVLEKSGEKSPKRQYSFRIPFVPLKSTHSLLN